MLQAVSPPSLEHLSPLAQLTSPSFASLSLAIHSLAWVGDLVSMASTGCQPIAPQALPADPSLNRACSSRNLQHPQTPRCSALPLVSICLWWTYRRRWMTVGVKRP